MLPFLLGLLIGQVPAEADPDKRGREAELAAYREHYTALGVYDPDEWRLKSYWSLEGDLKVMRWRVENVPADAPGLDALHHLPDVDTAFRNVQDAGLYIRHLESLEWWLLEGWERNALYALIDDAKERQKVWTAVYGVNAFRWREEGRRWHLNELREMVGDDVFCGRAAWPDPLPEQAYLCQEWRALQEEVVDG